MDNQHTNRDDVYEQYVDASVALFMKYYCDTLYEDVTDRAACTQENAGAAFPAELDARCRTLIKKTVRRQRFRKKVRYAGMALRCICSFVIVCLALASFLFVTVEAVRIPIINYYVEHSENNILKVGSKDYSTEDEWNEPFDIADPLNEIIPEEYVLISQEGNSISKFTAIYNSAHNSSIFISARPLDYVTDIDLQDADNIKKFQIYNCEAVMSEENNTTRLVWIHEELSITFTLVLHRESDVDPVFIADQIIRKIS